MKNLLFISFGLFFVLLVSACSEGTTRQNLGAIILNDSSTIVTETDSDYLKDMVLDMEAKQIVEKQPKPESKIEKKQAEEKTIVKAEIQKEQGFTLDFGTVKMMMTGIKATEYQQQNPLKDAGLSYACTEGDIAKNSLIFYNVNEVEIEQRYQTALSLKSSLGTISLRRDLGLATSDWKELKGNKSGSTIRFDLNSLKSPDFNKISNPTLKNALEKELRRQRTDRATKNKWLSEIRRTRNADDKPCEIILHDVQWRISGTDSKGRHFRKTIRLDAKAV